MGTKIDKGLYDLYHQNLTTAMTDAFEAAGQPDLPIGRNPDDSPEMGAR